MAEPITGINAKVMINIAGGGEAQLNHTTRWSLSKTAANATYLTSNTSGHERAALGGKSKKVSIDVLLDGATYPTINEGDTITSVKLYTDATTYEEYQGIVDSIDNIEADIQGSGTLGFTLNATVWPTS
jgi:hypothetical protein